MMTLLLLAASVAGAAELVLHDGKSAAAAVDRAADALDVAPSNLRGATLSQLFAGTSIGVGGAGSVTECSKEPTRWSDIKTALEQAEGDVNYGRFTDASKRLDGAAATMNCLSDPLDPVAAARVFYLRGVLHFQAGNNREAFVSFRQAFLFRSDLAWDNAFAPRNGKDLFDSARADLERQESAWFTLVPQDAAPAVLVDGKAMPADSPRVSLRAGRHLVQVGYRERDAAWVTLEPGEETRVLAYAAVSDAAVEALADPVERTEMIELLTESLGPVTPLTAVVGRTVWRGISGSEEWTLIARATRRERVATGLTWSGGVVLAGGAGWTIATYASARSLYKACETGTYGDCQDNEQPYSDKVGLLPIAGAVTIGGAALLSTGLLLDTRTGVGFAPTWLEGGPGVRFVFVGRER